MQVRWGFLSLFDERSASENLLDIDQYKIDKSGIKNPASDPNTGLSMLAYLFKRGSRRFLRPRTSNSTIVVGGPAILKRLFRLRSILLSTYASQVAEE